MTTPKADRPFTFDCIAYKRRVQEEIYEATKNMSPAEELAYYRDRAENGPLGEWWKSLRRANGMRPSR